MMKIYLCAPKINENTASFLEKTVKLLKKYNIKNIDNSYFESSLDDGKINPKRYFQNIENSVNTCDALIAETSYRSSGIGLIIGMAITKNKPVLILHNQNISNSISLNLSTTTTKSDKISFLGYDDKSLDPIIKNFLMYVDDESKSKFLINLPGEITKYLNWYSQNYRTSKADHIRKLVEIEMKSNEEWNKLLIS